MLFLIIIFDSSFLKLTLKIAKKFSSVLRRPKLLKTINTLQKAKNKNKAAWKVVKKEKGGIDYSPLPEINFNGFKVTDLFCLTLIFN